MSYPLLILSEKKNLQVKLEKMVIYVNGLEFFLIKSFIILDKIKFSYLTEPSSNCYGNQKKNFTSFKYI